MSLAYFMGIADDQLVRNDKGYKGRIHDFGVPWGHYYFLNGNHSQTYGYGHWKWHIETAYDQRTPPLNKRVVCDKDRIIIHRETSHHLHEGDNVRLGKLMHDTGMRVLQAQLDKRDSANVSQREYVAKKRLLIGKLEILAQRTGPVYARWLQIELEELKPVEVKEFDEEQMGFHLTYVAWVNRELERVKGDNNL